MAAIGGYILAAGFSSPYDKLRLNPIPSSIRGIRTRSQKTMKSFAENGRFEKNILELGKQEMKIRKRLKDYFEESTDLIRWASGPPRWFSPLECGSRSDNSPLLLFLPGYFFFSNSFYLFIFLVGALSDLA